MNRKQLVYRIALDMCLEDAFGAEVGMHQSDTEDYWYGYIDTNLEEAIDYIAGKTIDYLEAEGLDCE